MAVLERVRSGVGAVILARVAGPEGARQRDRIHGRPGPRLAEPGTPIWRVHGDAAMFVGGVRALLLQALHPAAMRAVSEHSGYRSDMLGRLARTSTFIATTTFGHVEDAQEAIETVRRIHRHVRGSMPDGTPYRADDPHLLEWVHVAEIDSFLTAYQAYGARPLTPDERDEYVAQTAEVARRLGVIDPPLTERDLKRRLAAFRPELRSTPEAREAVRYVLLGPPLGLPERLPYAVLVAAAVGLMPRWARWPLRLPWLPVTERTVVRALGTLTTGTIRWAMTPPPSPPPR